MVVLRDTSQWGHCPAPETPYSIVTNMSGWDTLAAFIAGDRSMMASCTHLYPRFMPTQFVRKLGMQILQKLGIQGKGITIYLNPDIFAFARRHVASEHRGPKAMDPNNLIFKCVDIAGHRLYCIIFDISNAPAVSGVWSNIGLGLSIRAAEHLLPQAHTLVEVPLPPRADPVPEPTWTPEGPAHQGLRERIHELLHHAARDPAKVTSSPRDVFLYPSGMAAVHYAYKHLLAYRPGHIVMVGIAYQATHDYLAEQLGERFKLVGSVGEQAMDEMEQWLEAKACEGQPVSFVITEVTINPLAETPDTARLQRLSEKYGFAIIIDDTIGGFGNVDVLPRADLVLTSLSKSFSGLANVIGGSVVLNPQSPHYAALAPLFRAAAPRNELFHGDAAALLDNARDFLPRTAVFNRNAAAIAAFLHARAQDPRSPVTKVWYPPYLPSGRFYDELKRLPSGDVPEPGYGCVLTVDFDCKESAKAFYDRLGFVIGPHLGAPQSLAMAYNMFLFGHNPDQTAHFQSLGMKEAAVRISAGLESEEDVIDTIKDALEAAGEARGADGKC
ncbi:putative cystathionine gamma-synthase [Escovopsis weberi]|uniref:Putative cystathionine gamma-synthase n=1 Tax=Escovopsis weberi TaxID=150374 RepID=A0A0M9VVZ8_ESCWE|nr:putative cystathionine gamma-synthase [Escovopsis weberi]